MKKYSAEYFEKKFKILYNKLLVREGFIDEVKKKRKELGIPVESGFSSSLDLAEYLIKKLTTKEREEAIFIAYMHKYENEKKTLATEENRNDFVDSFLKERKKEMDSLILAIIFVKSKIDDHTFTFTDGFFFRKFNKNKLISKLKPSVYAISDKYWDVDLLDEQITIHFIERYLFLGENGVNDYIKSRIGCPNCQHIGIHYFSPDRNHMQGKSAGAFSKNYIFNQETNKWLSQHFNSIFLIVKPYATKEQVIQYVKDNWDTMKKLMDEKNVFYKQAGASTKIKESDFEKNQLVYSLYSLTKEQLIRQYKELEKNLLIPQYKESVISKILEKRYDIKMSPDAIKRSATRFAKSIKIQRKQKDIGDI